MIWEKKLQCRKMDRKPNGKKIPTNLSKVGKKNQRENQNKWIKVSAEKFNSFFTHPGTSKVDDADDDQNNQVIKKQLHTFVFHFLIIRWVFVCFTFDSRLIRTTKATRRMR